MKILYLAHRIPYPPNKGDKIRSFHEIKFLSKSHQIHLCCLADNPKDLQYAGDLKAYCQTVTIVPINPRIARLKSMQYLFSGRPLSIPYFYSRKLQKAVDRLLSAIAFDCILCFSSPMAEYLFRSPALDVYNDTHNGTYNGTYNGTHDGRHNNKCNNTHNSSLPFAPRLIMDFCDVDSHKWIQYGQSSSFPLSLLYRLEGRRLAAYERKIAESFDHSVVISQKEAEIFRSQNPHIPLITVVANGVDYAYFNPDELYPLPPLPPQSLLAPASGKQATSPKHAPSPLLVFTGAMDYHANVDAVVWFCKEIFPALKACIPHIRFYIVGSNPCQKVKLLENGDGIKVTGFVEDIRPYYQRADVCVIPLRLGRGVQNKVLEAMAMGKAIVTTPKALEGINAVAGEHLLVGNDQESISRAILMLLNDEGLRIKLGAKARHYVKTHYNWSSNTKKLESLLQADHEHDETIFVGAAVSVN